MANNVENIYLDTRPFSVSFNFNRYLQDQRIMQTVAVLLGIDADVQDNDGMF